MVRLTGNKVSTREERGLEDYQSPPDILEALMRVEGLPQVLWEPACGTCNLVGVMRSADRTVYASDVNPAYSAIGGRVGGDFLEMDIPPAFRPRPTAIVTNPPFSLLGRFAMHAMEMGMEAYLFGRLNYMEGGERDKIRDLLLERRCGLNRVFVLRERPKGMHRTGYEGPKSTTQMTHAWFHWKPGFKGEAKIRRISLLKTGPLLPPPRPKEQRKRGADTVEMFAMEDAS